MDDIIKICDELENCKRSKICFKNTIECTRRVLNAYIDNDYDKLLKLKAELDIHRNFDNVMLSNFSFATSVFAVLLSVFNGLITVSKSFMSVYSGFVSAGIFFMAIIFIRVSAYRNRNSARSKWLKYISVVIEDMEKVQGKK